MHDLTEQVERLAMMVLLILFGGALVTGLLATVTWIDAGIVAVILLVIRPAAGLLGMIGFKAQRGEKLTLAFFGIRGVGTFYYLAYGMNHMAIADPGRLWGLVGLIVLGSILMHGLTVTPIMRSLDREQGRDPDADEQPATTG
jgi:sodium/hydrogen antiporter